MDNRAVSDEMALFFFIKLSLKQVPFHPAVIFYYLCSIMALEDIIYGLRPVTEALLSGRGIDKILIQKGLKSEGFRELMDALRQSSVPHQFVPPEKLNKVIRGNHQGVIAFLKLIDYPELHQVIPGIFENGRDPFVLVLDHITDVRNFGALARTAECAGADVIVIPESGAARINAVAMKASAGALSKIPVCRVKRLREAVTYLKECGISIISVSEKASTPYYRADFCKPAALVMGSEEDGISRDILGLCDEHLCIPMAGTIGSLNVSVAAGILMFEVLRQREEK
jgi:23S rRNA (guanosine2251-2'-O)-methyltransferase